jgi:hypothetical protein
LALASLLLANIGSASESPPLHNGPWPIGNGHNYEPTEQELKALHLEDVTPDQARKRPQPPSRTQALMAVCRSRYLLA